VWAFIENEFIFEDQHPQLSKLLECLSQVSDTFWSFSVDTRDLALELAVHFSEFTKIALPVVVHLDQAVRMGITEKFCFGLTVFLAKYHVPLDNKSTSLLKLFHDVIMKWTIMVPVFDFLLGLRWEYNFFQLEEIVPLFWHYISSSAVSNHRCVNQQVAQLWKQLREETQPFIQQQLNSDTVPLFIREWKHILEADDDFWVIWKRETAKVSFNCPSKRSLELVDNQPSDADNSFKSKTTDNNNNLKGSSINNSNDNNNK
jgi:hypothetical protein